jgi:hypothetical protein
MTSVIITLLRTKTEKDWKKFQASKTYKGLLDDVKPATTTQETHKSQAFIGHIGQDAPAGNL